MPVKFSLVVPTYNEAANIRQLYQRIIDCLAKMPFDSEIIIVDDNSPDGTFAVMDDLTKADQRLKLIRRIKERGLASAVVSGWAASCGEILGVMDADLQHPPEVLKGMLNKIINNNEIDIVIASRYVAGGKVLNQNFLQALRSAAAIFLGRIFIPKIFKLIKDPLSGYFILRKKVIEGKKLAPIGYKILLEVLARCQDKNVFEMPYVFEQRKKGKSKAGWKQYLIFLVHLFKLRGFKCFRKQN